MAKLIDERPLVILPTLAASVGLNEAIVLQQVQYWISNPKTGIVLEGQKWVYNSYENWQEENFPFWSVSGVKKIFLRLEEMGLLISKQLSQNKWDKTKYYRINYGKLNDSLLSPLGSESPVDSTREVLSTSNIDYSENGVDEISAARLPVEWQIAAGVDKVVMPDEKESQYMDTANIIATGMGANDHIAYAIAYTFMHTRGIIIPSSKVKGQRKAIREMMEMGVLPNHVQEATQKLMDDGMTIADLYSISKTAIALANPAPETYMGAIDGI